MGGKGWGEKDRKGRKAKEKRKRGEKKKMCTDRESNPGLPRGRREFYH